MRTTVRRWSRWRTAHSCRLGPARMQRPLAHWDGDVFTSTLHNENATPGTISKATFAGNRVNLEYYDREHLGTIFR